MQKQQTKTVATPVGAYCIRPHFEGMAKKETGITLIALVITIIVMMILVAVSVTVALNGGLFRTAKQAKEETATERNEELNLSDGQVEINGEGYISIDEYVNGSGNGAGVEVTLPTGWEVTTKPETWTSNKVTAIKETATGKIVALPEGYSISEVSDEQTVDGGLVITDGTNEFVWIPITTDFTVTYTATFGSASNSLEPTEITYINSNSGAARDSQTTLDYLYGEGYYDYPETAEEKADVNNTFAYSAHYGEMVTSVNTYGGFYIGRYETTIDGSTIGVQRGKTLLTAGTLLKEGTEYGWWGLYASQRNSNVAGNGTTVQTNMIWGQQWDAMITYFGSKDYSGTPVKTLATSGIQNAGEAKYAYNGETISDKICNIFDLRGNTGEYTAECWDWVENPIRMRRGGLFNSRYSADSRCPTMRGSFKLLWFTPRALYKITKGLHNIQQAKEK